MGLDKQTWLWTEIANSNTLFSEIFHNNSPLWPLSLKYVISKSFLTSEMLEVGADIPSFKFKT